MDIDACHASNGGGVHATADFGGLVTRLSLCPLCDGPTRFYAALGDWLYGFSDATVKLHRCQQCGALSQYPLPDAHQSASFYGSGYWLESQQPSGLQKGYIDLMMRWDLMRWVARLGLDEGQSILDIGCSRGDWLHRMHRMGYRVQGLEADERAAKYARSHYGLDVINGSAGDWLAEEGSLDAITLFHVLEHVVDPVSLISKCHAALRQGGKLLLRVPNVASWQARILGVRWKGLEPPRHILHFNPRCLVDLIVGAGFTVEARSTWSLRDGPPGWASSLFPSGEPTWQTVHQRPSTLRTFIYAGLTWFLTPLEVLAAILLKGGMITVIAVK